MDNKPSRRTDQKQLLLSIDPSKFGDELRYGLDAATELLSLVRKRNPASTSHDMQEEGLVLQIMKSFTTTLSMLGAEVSGEIGDGKSATRYRK